MSSGSDLSGYEVELIASALDAISTLLTAIEVVERAQRALDVATAELIEARSVVAAFEAFGPR